MSTPGIVVVRMGRTVVHFRRHWGGPASTGVALLQILAEAPSLRERSHFHEGAYVIREIANLPSTLSGARTSKLANLVTTEFIITDGDVDEGYEYGFELRAITRPEGEDSGSVASTVHWEIRFNCDRFAFYEDWIEAADVFTSRELVEHLIQRIGSDSRMSDNALHKQALLNALADLRL